jgi:hypothetical protein
VLANLAVVDPVDPAAFYHQRYLLPTLDALGLDTPQMLEPDDAFIRAHLPRGLEEARRSRSP